MKIAIYTSDTEIGNWAKETLEEFGRGMHIRVLSCHDKEALSLNWSYIITFGECDADVPSEKQHTRFSIPVNEEERMECRRRLWALYRDTLRDMIGGKCSCGLFDVCHCH